MTADPMPAREGGSTSMMDSVAGVDTSPMPEPHEQHLGDDDRPVGGVGVDAAGDPRHRAEADESADDDGAGADAWCSSPPQTEPIAIDSATGRIRRPVSSGLNPRNTWKYWVMRKMSLRRQKKVTVTDVLAALIGDRQKSVMSSMGWWAAC